MEFGSLLALRAEGTTQPYTRVSLSSYTAAMRYSTSSWITPQSRTATIRLTEVVGALLHFQAVSVLRHYCPLAGCVSQTV